LTKNAPLMSRWTVKSANFFRKPAFALQRLATGLMRLPGIWRVESRFSGCFQAVRYFFGGLLGGLARA